MDWFLAKSGETFPQAQPLKSIKRIEKVLDSLVIAELMVREENEEAPVDGFSF